MYQFYSEGFFGYGDKGDFAPGSFWHFLPIFVLALGVVLIVLERGRLRGWRGERRFRFIFAFVMLVAEMSYFWRLLYVGDETGANSLMIKLPLHVCQWGLYCAAFAMMTESDTLLGISFFVTLCLTAPALFVPSVIVRTGPAYYRYYQYWMEHGLPVIAVAYMMAVHEKKPRYRQLWLSVGLLMLLSIPCMIANHSIPNANFMYLGNYVSGSDLTVDPLSFFPKPQAARYAAMFAVVIVFFHGLFFLWKWIHTAWLRRTHWRRACDESAT